MYHLLDKQSIRDELLKIASQNESFSTFDSISSPDALDLILSTFTGQAVEEFNTCYRASYSCKKVSVYDWPEDLDCFTYLSKNCIFDVQEFEQKL